MRKSKLGRLLVALRDKEERVRFSGYDVSNFKIFVFCIAAMISAIGGAMFTLQVGFMSQSFSLYGELSVRQNLDLHARLFQLTGEHRRERMALLTERFGLDRYLEQRAEQLPLGVRQRLSLAVAMIHEPELLILDEPTSGVDPVARDRFWSLLVELSREQGVTIFISTHFMNEAERCDRISLMHAGRVLAQGTPDELKAAQGTASLDDSFIAFIEQAEVIRKILQHLGLWCARRKPLPRANAPPVPYVAEDVEGWLPTVDDDMIESLSRSAPRQAGILRRLREGPVTKLTVRGMSTPCRAARTRSQASS